MDDHDDFFETFEEKEIAPSELIEKFSEINSCSTIDMFTPSKSRGKVFSWRECNWVSVGSCSSGDEGYYEVTIRKVIEKDLYRGKKNDPNKSGGPDFYLGGYLKSGKQEWIMLPYELTLVREDRARWEQVSFDLSEEGRDDYHKSRYMEPS